MTMKRPKIKSPGATQPAVLASVIPANNQTDAGAAAPLSGAAKRGRGKIAGKKVNGRSTAKSPLPPAVMPHVDADVPDQQLQNAAPYQNGFADPQIDAGYQPEQIHLAEQPSQPPEFQPQNPLSNLQAGLDLLNSRPEQPPSRPDYADDLTAVFNSAASQQTPLSADALATLASVVGRAELPPPQAIRPPVPPARSRPARLAPDLSKLPPGLAASLAKLAGGPVDPPHDGTTPPIRKNGRG